MQRGVGGLHMTREQGCAGFCAVGSLFFGIFLVFPGVTLTAMGNRDTSEFFESHNRPLRVIGPILLVLGICLVITGVALCIFLRRPGAQQAFSNNLQTNQAAHPIVVGSSSGMPQYTHPVVVAGPAQPGQVTYPAGTQMMPLQQQGYQGAGYPGASYQSGNVTQGVHYPQGHGYAPQQPPQAYTPGGQPQAPMPQAGSYHPQPTASAFSSGDNTGGAPPPPSYDAVMEKEMK